MTKRLMPDFTVRNLALGAMIAAVYTALSLVLGAFSFGQVQVRASEALIALCPFLAIAPWGLTLGCLITNLIGGMGLMDVLVGTLSTLTAALLARKLPPALMPLPAVVINAFSVAWVLNVMLELPYWISVLSVGAGQAIACYGLGLPLYYLLKRYEVPLGLR